MSRETFTLAHEIGHIVLHFEKYSSFIDDYNYNHNAILIKTLEKVLEAYQLTIEDISDKLITTKDEEDSDT